MCKQPHIRVTSKLFTNDNNVKFWLQSYTLIADGHNMTSSSQQAEVNHIN